MNVDTYTSFYYFPPVLRESFHYYPFNTVDTGVNQRSVISCVGFIERVKGS